MASCNQEFNKKSCKCTYGCPRSGKCCECIRYHRRMGQLPACYFPADVERGYDRSIDNFIETVKERGTAYLRK